MRSLIRVYENLLINNLAVVSTVESGIRNITWLLPGRFEDAEITSEGLYTVLNVVSLYHDTLIQTRLNPQLYLPPHPFDTISPSLSSSASASTSTSTRYEKRRIHPILPPPSDHSRYTRYWSQKSVIYRKSARIMTLLKYVELLVEMLARRKGDRIRWRFVLVIESIKTFLRLILLRLTRRPTLSHPTPQRELDISSLPAEILSATPSISQAINLSGSDDPSTSEPILPLMTQGAPLRSHLYPISEALPETHLLHPSYFIPEIKTPTGYLAEMIDSSVGLIQVILLLRLAKRNTKTLRPYSLPTLSRSLPPFLIPLFLRLLARHLRESPRDSTLLAQHYAQQDKKILRSFFLSGPVWIGYTRPKIQSWLEWFEKWPGLSLLGEFGSGYLPLVDEYFYCELGH